MQPSELTSLDGTDSHVALPVLPEEIWLHVLKFVSNAQRTISLATVCTAWRELVFRCVVCLYAGEYDLTDAILRRFVALETLRLGYPFLNSCVTDYGIELLGNTLELFDLGNNSEVSDEGVSRLTNLTELTIGDAPIGDRGICGLTRLVVLRIYEGANVTSEGVASLVNLTKLDLTANTVIADRGIQSLSLLHTLVLASNSGITNDGLGALANRLTYLDLERNGKVTDVGITGLTNLTCLILTANDNVSNNAVSRLTALKLLDLDLNHVISNAGIRTLTALEALILRNNVMITNAGLTPLSKHLTALQLMDNAVITVDGLARLTNLRGIIMNQRSRGICQAMEKINAMVQIRNMGEFPSSIFGHFGRESSDYFT